MTKKKPKVKGINKQNSKRSNKFSTLDNNNTNNSKQSGKVKSRDRKEKNNQFPETMKLKDQTGVEKTVGNDPKSNDISWYTKVSTILSPVTKVAAVPVQGMTTTVETSIHLKYGTKKADKKQVSDNYNFTHRMPGVMSFEYKPVIPGCESLGGLVIQGNSPSSLDVKFSSHTDDSGLSALEIMARNLFAQLRRKLTGGAAKLYAPQDIVSYTVVISSLIAYIKHLQLIYKVAFYSNPWTKYSREVITSIVGHKQDYSILLEHGPSILSRINRLLVALRAFLLPTSISLVHRWAWLNSEVFVDSQNPNAGMYINKPTGIFEIKYGNTTDLNSRLTGVNSYKDAYVIELTSLVDKTILEKITYIEKVIGNLQENDAFLYINADLLKAYGTESIDFSLLSSLTEVDNPIYIPKYDLEYLFQIQNASIIRPTYVPSKYRVLVNTAETTFKLMVDLSHFGVFESAVSATTLLPSTAYLFHDNKSLSDVETIIATRLTAIPVFYRSGATSDLPVKFHLISGTEVITKSKVYSPDGPEASNGIWVTDPYIIHLRTPRNDQGAVTLYDTFLPQDEAVNGYRLMHMAAAAQFRKSPMLYLAHVDPTETMAGKSPSGYSHTLHFTKDVDNYSIIRWHQLKPIHDAVFASQIGLSDTDLLISGLKSRQGN